MMQLIKLGLLLDQNVNTKLQEAIHSQENIVDSYNFYKSYQSVVSAQEDFQKMRMVLLEKFCEKDDNGALKTNEDGSKYLLKDEDAFKKSYEDLINIEVPLLELSVGSLMDYLPKLSQQ